MTVDEIFADMTQEAIRDMPHWDGSFTRMGPSSAPLWPSVCAAEAAYFDGNHCQHVAAYEDAKRLERIKRTNAALVRRMTR